MAPARGLPVEPSVIIPDTSIFKLGLKFTPSPKDPAWIHYENSILQFRRSILIKEYFKDFPERTFDPKLPFVKSDWTPAFDFRTFDVYSAFSEFLPNLKEDYLDMPISRLTNHSSFYKAKSFLKNGNFKLIQTDKNRGLCLLKIQD